eukprot:TRINITY_DN9202_c0_g1_i11.p1 TRINITY_DN9202_c0_g1~~TRINITY_DN9202_c0_g1_i11.p1  ORF type:complete len:164 (-),score=22.08 TRINITY_DN9202_c0_g1_i11:714-1205(-)
MSEDFKVPMPNEPTSTKRPDLHVDISAKKIDLTLKCKSPLLVRKDSGSTSTSPLTKALKTGLGTRISSAQEIPNFTKYGKYTIFWESTRDKEVIYEVTLELPDFCLAKDGIRQAIKALNDQFCSEKKGFVINASDTSFELYAAKKTGKAKIDYPGKWFLCVWC